MDVEQLHSFFVLKSSGEIKVNSEVIGNLTHLICKCANTTSFEEAHKKTRRESRARIKTYSCFYPDVFSIPKSVVKHWARSIGLVAVPGLYSDLDLVSGKYEGGFKVWEATNDLVKFLTKDHGVMDDLLHKGDKFRCLELGAGAALPTLALIGRLVEDTNFNSDYLFHVQDYNWQVLASLTLLNFAINLPSDYYKSLIDTKCLRFFYGDWSDFRKNTSHKYDLIMMSEVIYNCDNYGALHNLLDRHLRQDGYIVMATKDTYFGLTGGLYSWLDYLVTKSTFSPHRIIKVVTINIPRSILILKRVIN